MSQGSKDGYLLPKPVAESTAPIALHVFSGLHLDSAFHYRIISNTIKSRQYTRTSLTVAKAWCSNCFSSSAIGALILLSMCQVRGFNWSIAKAVVLRHVSLRLCDNLVCYKVFLPRMIHSLNMSIISSLEDGTGANVVMNYHGVCSM